MKYWRVKWQWVNFPSSHDGYYILDSVIPTYDFIPAGWFDTSEDCAWKLLELNLKQIR